MMAEPSVDNWKVKRNINTRNTASRIKNGSPKIREVLRQRCRQRMHERREEIFSKRRFGSTEEVKDALADIVHEQFEQMDCMDLEIQSSPKLSKTPAFPTFSGHANAIEDEMLVIEEELEEQWILEEYQKMLTEQQQILSMFEDTIICPICLKSIMKEIPGFAICDCGLRLPIQHGLEFLKQNLREQVNTHSSICLDVPKFSIYQDCDNVSLYLFCESCDAFALI